MGRPPISKCIRPSFNAIQYSNSGIPLWTTNSGTGLNASLQSQNTILNNKNFIIGNHIVDRRCCPYVSGLLFDDILQFNGFGSNKVIRTIINKDSNLFFSNDNINIINREDFISNDVFYKGHLSSGLIQSGGESGQIVPQINFDWAITSPNTTTELLRPSLQVEEVGEGPNNQKTIFPIGFDNTISIRTELLQRGGNGFNTQYRIHLFDSNAQNLSSCWLHGAEGDFNKNNLRLSTNVEVNNTSVPLDIYTETPRSIGIGSFTTIGDRVVPTNITRKKILDNIHLIESLSGNINVNINPDPIKIRDTNTVKSIIDLEFVNNLGNQNISIHPFSLNATKLSILPPAIVKNHEIKKPEFRLLNNNYHSYRTGSYHIGGTAGFLGGGADVEGILVGDFSIQRIPNDIFIKNLGIHRNQWFSSNTFNRIKQEYLFAIFQNDDVFPDNLFFDQDGVGFGFQGALYNGCQNTRLPSIAIGRKEFFESAISEDGIINTIEEDITKTLYIRLIENPIGSVTINTKIKGIPELFIPAPVQTNLIASLALSYDFNSNTWTGLSSLAEDFKNNSILGPLLGDANITINNNDFFITYPIENPIQLNCPPIFRSKYRFGGTEGGLISIGQPIIRSDEVVFGGSANTHYFDIPTSDFIKVVEIKQKEIFFDDGSFSGCVIKRGTFPFSFSVDYDGGEFPIDTNLNDIIKGTIGPFPEFLQSNFFDNIAFSEQGQVLTFDYSSRTKSGTSEPFRDSGKQLEYAENSIFNAGLYDINGKLNLFNKHLSSGLAMDGIVERGNISSNSKINIINNNVITVGQTFNDDKVRLYLQNLSDNTDTIVNLSKDVFVRTLWNSRGKILTDFEKNSICSGQRTFNNFSLQGPWVFNSHLYLSDDIQLYKYDILGNLLWNTHIGTRINDIKQDNNTLICALNSDFWGNDIINRSPEFFTDITGFGFGETITTSGLAIFSNALVNNGAYFLKGSNNQSELIKNNINANNFLGSLEDLGILGYDTSIGGPLNNQAIGLTYNSVPTAFTLEGEPDFIEKSGSLDFCKYIGMRINDTNGNIVNIFPPIFRKTFNSVTPIEQGNNCQQVIVNDDSIILTEI